MKKYAHILVLIIISLVALLIGDVILLIKVSSDSVLLVPIILVTLSLALCAITLICTIKVLKSAHKQNDIGKQRTLFVNSTSREVRSSLNDIVGLNNLLKSSLDDKEKTQTYIKRMEAISNYLLTVVSDVFDASSVDLCTKDLKYECFSIKELIDSSIGIYTEDAKSKGLKMITDNSIKNEYVFGDYDKLKKVVVCVLNNAVRYTKKGDSIFVRATQNVLENKKVNTVIEIEDTGCGMDEKTQANVFASVMDLNPDIDPKTFSHGLSMPLSYRLMTLMGGTISVDSRLGVGTIFVITISNDIGTQTDLPKVNPLDEMKNILMNYNILMAEDNNLNAEILSEVLTDAGAKVERAVNGKEALEKFDKSAPEFYNLILMDVTMPVMNGLDATKAIRSLKRKDAKTVPIYACTANFFKEDIDAAKEAGMNDVIVKPVSIKKLLEKLEK